MPWTWDKVFRVAYAVAAWVGSTCLGYLPVSIFFVSYPRNHFFKVRHLTRPRLDRAERAKRVRDRLGDKLPVADVCDLVAQYNAKFAAELVHEFPWSLPAISSIAAVTSTRVAVACADDTVQVWDLWAARCVWTVKQPSVKQMVAFGTDLLVCGSPTEVVVWDLNTKQSRCKLPLTDVYRMVATVRGLAVISGAERFLDVWDVEARDLVQYMGRHATSLSSVADGRQIAACFMDGIVRVFDVCTGRCVSKLALHLEHVDLAALSCGRIVMLTCSSVCIWDPNSRFPTVFIEVPKVIGSEQFRLVAALDHETLVSMTVCGVWHAWDAITGLRLDTFTLPATERADYSGDRAADRVLVIGNAIVFLSDRRVSLYQ